MILIYRILSTLLYPILFLFINLRVFLKKEDPIRYKEKIFFSKFDIRKKEGFKLIWFHAASIGEYKSIIPIIDQLSQNFRNIQFLITTTTLSSGNLAKIDFKNSNKIEHRYLPYDVPFLMNKFFKMWCPDRIFLVDSEIWPNLIMKAKELNIPIALINARLTLKSFKRWMMFKNVAKKIFNVFDLFICSNNETKIFLEELNLKQVYFKGNLKLISKIDKKEIKNTNIEILAKKRFWFAASIHEGEELLCLKTHLELKKTYKDIITIIAPRHLDKVKKIESLFDKYNLNVQLLEKNQKIIDKKEIIIINHFGDLQNYFKFAKSAFIGKSTSEKFKDNGGQNPLEAVILDCKIYHGPYVYNFNEIYRILKVYEISKIVDNYEDLSKNLIMDLKNPIKQESQNPNPINDLSQKTLVDTMKLVENFIFNDPS